MKTFKELSSEPAAWILSSEAFTNERMDAAYYEPRFLRDAAELSALPLDKKEFREVSSKLNCGATPKLVEYGGIGLPLIRTSNVRPNTYDPSDTLRVPGMSVDAKSNIAILPGDVLYTMSGSVGYTAVYPVNAELASCSNTIARARLDKESEDDPYYVALFLNSRLGLSQSLRLVSGGVLAHVMPNSVKRLRVALPSPQTQRAIGNKVRKAERFRELLSRVSNKVGRWINNAAVLSLLSQLEREYLEHSPDKTCPDSVWAVGIDAADRIDPWPHHVAPRQVRKHLKQVAKAKPFDYFFELASDSRKKSQEKSRGQYHISILDVDTDGYIDWEAASKSQIEGAGIEIKANDILFPGLNPKETRVCVIPDSFKETAYASPEFIVLRLHPDAEQVPYLLTAVLRSPWVRVQTAFLTRSSSLSRRRLQENDLSHVLIPWQDEQAIELNKELVAATRAKQESVKLVENAKADVEALIDNTLDQEKLLKEGEEIERWLKENPSQ